MIEYRLSKWLENLLEDFGFFVATTHALLDPRTEKAIWTEPTEPQKTN